MQPLAQGLVRRQGVVGRNDPGDDLAVGRCRIRRGVVDGLHGNGHCPDGGVLSQCDLDFLGVDALTADLELPVKTTEQPHVSVLIHPGPVAGPVGRAQFAEQPGLAKGRGQ